MYEDTETEKLKELYKTYFRLKHRERSPKDTIKTWYMVLSLLILGAAALNVLRSGLDLINGTFIFVGCFGVYMWKKQEEENKFYSKQLQLIQKELRDRGCA